MQDVYHKIFLDGPNYACIDCGRQFPENLVLHARSAGCDVLVDPGGFGVQAFPEFLSLLGRNAISCTRAPEQTADELVIEQTPLEDEDLEREGLEKVRPLSSTPQEKSLRSGQFQTWLAMREATKPNE